MKKILTLLAVLVTGYSFGQCTLSGLSPFYCSSDSGSQLTASCGGSSGTILGPGVNSSGFFDPSGLQDSIAITVLAGTTTYTVDQSLPYNPDTTSGGTGVTLGDDAVSGQLSIGFTFRFFDNQYTTFQISSNGFITFGTNNDNGCCSGDYIPSSSTPNNYIAHVWADLYPPGAGTITYKTVGVAPNRKCIIDFSGIPQCCGTSYPRYSQIHLFEGCGRIEMHTQSQPNGFTTSTQGIENSNGTTGYATPGRNSTSWTATNDFVAFQPNCGDTFWTVVSEGPDLSIVGDTNDCFSDSNATATVTASGVSPFTYSWSNGETTATISGLPSGTYTTTVTDDDGCYNSASVEIYSPDPLVPHLNGTNAYCETDANGYILASGNGGVEPYSYSWSNGSTGDSVGGLAPGAYTLTITDANGCTSSSFTTLDYDHENPIVDLGADKKICPGKIALLTTTPGYAGYAWSTGDTVPNVVVQQAGTYTVTVTSAAGCYGSDELVVIEVVPVQVDLGPNLEGLAPIVVDAGSQFNQFIWNTGANTQSINVGTSGTYAVTVADTNGCGSDDEIKVIIWPASVGEIEAGDFAVFPNPATSVVSLVSGSSYGELNIRLVDMSGRAVLTMQRAIGENEQMDINVGSFAKGNYTLEIQSDQMIQRRSVVLQ